jgi:hypothetical protein
MNLNKLWSLYEADKRIQGFSPKTLKAYALQHKMLMLDLGNLDVTKVTPTILKKPYLLAIRIQQNEWLYLRLGGE